MKNIDKAKLLEHIKEFFEKNNITIEACGCCGGYHLVYDGEELCEGSDFLEDVDDCIKYYKENQNKIFVDYYDNRFTDIEFIRDENKIVNLGGKSHPFTKYMNKRYRKFDDIVL